MHTALTFTMIVDGKYINLSKDARVAVKDILETQGVYPGRNVMVWSNQRCIPVGWPEGRSTEEFTAKVHSLYTVSHNLAKV